MTDRHRRAVLYARKSNKQDRTEEQSASVADQLDRGRAYAREHGWTVVKEFSDDGRSGLLDRTKRPGLDAALKVIEAGDADVLVTLWTSRLSREERQRAEILDVLDLLNVEWHAVADGGRIDRSTYAGYVTYGIHTLFDVAYSKRVGENWRRAQQKRLDAGLPKTTAHRFGYRYAKEAGYVPYEPEAEVVRELYRRYTRGEGFTQLVKWLNRSGWRVKRTGKYAGKDGEWTVRTLNRFLDSGFAAGYISREEQHRDLKGAHEPLISDQQWLAYRAEREKRAPLGKAATARDRWWLGGFVKCGICGGATYVDSFNRPDGKSSVMCSTHRGNPDACKGVTVLRSYVENAVGWWLLPHLDQLDALTNAEAKALADAAVGVFQEAVAGRDKIIDGLADLEETRLLGDIEPAVYRRTKERLSARLNDAEKAVLEAAAALEAPEADTSLLRSAAEDGWTADQRAALRGVLDRVEVGKDALTIVPVVGDPVTRTRAELAPRCGVAGCDRQHYTRGLCKSHAMRARNIAPQVFDALVERVSEDGPSITVEEVEAAFAAAR